MSRHCRWRESSLLAADDPARARAQTGLGAALLEAGRLDQALPELLSVFEGAADEVGLCQAWRLRATVHWLQADSGAAEEAWRQAAVHARRAGDERWSDEIELASGPG